MTKFPFEIKSIPGVDPYTIEVAIKDQEKVIESIEQITSDLRKKVEARVQSEIKRLGWLDKVGYRIEVSVNIVPRQNSDLYRHSVVLVYESLKYFTASIEMRLVPESE